MDGTDAATGDTLSAEGAPGRPLRTGDRLADRYRIVREIGRGGMGVVFVAFDEKVGENVAVKVLPRSGGANALERFRQEVRLARHVTHRSVARTFDIGEHEGLHYLTMELIEGESLAAILARDGRLSPRKTSQLIVQICSGLAVAHEAGVVHRDLKPANILVEASGRAVITDFGIARSVQTEDAYKTGEGAMVGTPAFMAPEQVLGLDATPRSDLYALGLVLYQALTGRPAFEHASVVASAVARLDADPLDPRRHVELPAALAELVLSCLARDPDARPIGARAVASVLSRFVDTSTPGPDLSPSGAELRPFMSVDPGGQALAVLPFRYRGSEDHAYVADALTDELIDLLSMTRGLKVCSRGATDRFREDREPRLVGSSLGVQSMVDGTTQVTGSKIRVTVRLVDTTSGIQSWSDRFETGLDTVFEVQDEIARRVAETLRLELEGRAHVGAAPAEAADLYLKARARMRHSTMGPGGPGATAEMFEKVVELAPGFKMARPALANAYISTWALPQQLDTTKDYGDLSRHAVREALARAANVPETHLASARLAVCEARLPDAAQALATALEMAPTYGSAHDYLGMLQLECGRPAEGRRRVELAIDLDPNLQLGYVALGRHLALHGRYDEFKQILVRAKGAARFTLKLVELRFAGWHRKPDEVRAAGERLAADFDGSTAPQILVAAFSGNLPDDIRVFVDSAAAKSTNPRSNTFVLQLVAEAYGAYGRVEQTLEALHRAADSALADVDWIHHCPALDCVREHPDFGPLRDRIEARAAGVWA